MHTKNRIKLFEIPGITANSIRQVTYKIPREVIKLTGFQTMCFLLTGPHLGPIDCAKITLCINDKSINPLQRYPVSGIRQWVSKNNDKKYLPISINEEVRAGSLIHASLEDLGISNMYPYKVTVYLHTIIQRQ